MKVVMEETPATLNTRNDLNGRRGENFVPGARRQNLNAVARIYVLYYTG
jgi:hypothetical protein